MQQKDWIKALAEWLSHKENCESVTTYHYDKVTGERVDKDCNCGLETLRKLLED